MFGPLRGVPRDMISISVNYVPEHRLLVLLCDLMHMCCVRVCEMGSWTHGEQ